MTPRQKAQHIVDEWLAHDVNDVIGLTNAITEALQDVAKVEWPHSGLGKLSDIVSSIRDSDTDYDAIQILHNFGRDNFLRGLNIEWPREDQIIEFAKDKFISNRDALSVVNWLKSRMSKEG